MPLMTLKQVAEELQLTVNTVRSYIANHELESIKLKRAVRIDSSDLKKWLQANKGKRGEVIIKKAKVKGKGG